MNSPRDLRRRIKSISGTAQITKAMQMVAASKMRKAQQAAIATQPFVRMLYRIQRIATTRDLDFRHPLLELVPGPEDTIVANERYFLNASTFQNHHGGMVFLNGYVYAGSGHNNGLPICIEMASGKVAWGGNFRNAGSGSAAVTAADGHIYYRYQNGVMMLVEATPAAYREKGSFTIPDVRLPSWSHPVVTGGRLYLREQDALHVYDVRR